MPEDQTFADSTIIDKFIQNAPPEWTEFRNKLSVQRDKLDEDGRSPRSWDVLAKGFSVGRVEYMSQAFWASFTRYPREIGLKTRFDLVRELETKLSKSGYHELRMYKDVKKFSALFTIKKGTPAGPNRWELWTPENTYFGNSAREVIEQASKPFPQIWDWLPEFNGR